MDYITIIDENQDENKLRQKQNEKMKKYNNNILLMCTFEKF